MYKKFKKSIYIQAKWQQKNPEVKNNVLCTNH